jgi:cyclophilin family peptidyl-prolyl cis-trans isomerase
MKNVTKVLFTLVAVSMLGAGCSQTTELTTTVPGTQDAVAEAVTETITDTPLQPAENIQSLPTPIMDTTQPLAFPGILSAEQITGKEVTIATAKGDIVIKLYPETAPNTVSNFVYLISQKFYDGVIFHRREEGFVIQGGDPTGTGRGGPGYSFADELKDDKTYKRGTVAMANAGPNTNGSQFFVMLADVALPHLYTIFGEVTEGMDVVDQIVVGDKMTSVVVE